MGDTVMGYNESINPIYLGFDYIDDLKTIFKTETGLDLYRWWEGYSLVNRNDFGAQVVCVLKQNNPAFTLAHYPYSPTGYGDSYGVDAYERDSRFHFILTVTAVGDIDSITTALEREFYETIPKIVHFFRAPDCSRPLINLPDMVSPESVPNEKPFLLDTLDPSTQVPYIYCDLRGNNEQPDAEPDLGLGDGGTEEENFGSSSGGTKENLRHKMFQEFKFYIGTRYDIINKGASL